MKANKMLRLECIAILPPVVVQRKSYLPSFILSDERKVVRIIRELEPFKFRTGDCKYLFNRDSANGMASREQNCKER